MCVVKAFAYGSDPLIIGKFLEKNNVDYLAVAYINEGVKLRSSGIKLPILILHPQIDDFDEILEYNLEPNIYSFRILERFLSKSKKHPFHLKFNTGLNRLGFKINDVDLLYNILGSGNNVSTSSKIEIFNIPSLTQYLIIAGPCALNTLSDWLFWEIQVLLSLGSSY